ncbi:type II toxin-antitoxin system RelE family toxin [Alicyclobacillus tolerans]|uniref:type II toxin-antitoxin system RelE family toxin n=1 Tax=Alicyclobacillus tolerans TaxID=90970 RepID=UPI003B7EBB82
MSDLIEKLNQTLREYGVEVKFSKNAKQDFKSYGKDEKTNIISMLVLQAKKGPLLKPDGNGKPLHKELAGFAKIKRNDLSLRIIYRPRRADELVVMEVIAIGPRDKEEVYRMAMRRLINFFDEMEHGKE